MKGMNLINIADACGGILHLPEGQEFLANEEITSIETDSRKAGEGSLFAAIVGERVDAHKFIPAVFAQGAMCVLSEQDLEDAAGAWIRVRSTLQALKDIAEYYLEVMDLPVVGITGSVGKTSTKEMIAAVLAQKYVTLKTLGNFNNELGLPLTIFRLRDEDQIAVLEMGISEFGEMHRLTKIAKPDTCVITNIGTCHLENLGDRDGVLRAKTEIFDSRNPEGAIILNGNDDRLVRVRDVDGVKPVFFGIKEDQKDPEVDWPELDVWADEIRPRGLRGISCRIHTVQGDFDVMVPIPGHHMVMNALAGTAVGMTHGLTLDEIKAGIESLQSLSGRFNIIETEHCTVIDDCYNANPMSMKASLQILRDAEGRKVAVLGDMGELGADEIRFHEEVGRCAAQEKIDRLIGIGERSASLVAAALAEDPEMSAVHYATLAEFMEKMAEEIKDGDTVLVKASHFMEFPKIVEALTKA